MKTTSLFLLFAFILTLNSFAIKPAKGDTLVSINNERLLIKQVVELINETLYKSDDDLPDFGIASLIINFEIDHEAKYHLLNVEGSDQIVNFKVKNRLENCSFLVNQNLKGKKFVLPVTYEKRPYDESYKKRRK